MPYLFVLIAVLWGCDDESSGGTLEGGTPNDRDGEAPMADAGDRPEDGGDDPQPDASASEGGTPEDAGDTPPDGGPGGDPDASSPASVVRTLPEDDHVYVRGTLRVQFVVEGDVEEIDIRIDGDVVARVPPPFAYDLDTTTLPEGEVQLTGTIAGDPPRASAPLTVTVDRTPPVVTERAPTANRDDVWCREPVEVTFSEPIAINTISASSLRIGGGGDVSLDAELSVADGARGATLLLSELPELPATLTVEATSAITDLAGNALTPDSWSFSMPVWADVAVPDGEHDPWGFGFVVTASGEQLVAWVDEDRAPQVARRTTNAFELLPAWDDAGPADRDAVRVALSADRPVVATLRDLDEEEVGGVPVLVRWNGTDWDELGSPDEVDGYAAPLHLLVDPTNGDLIVAARDQKAASPMLALWRVNDDGWTDAGGVADAGYWNGVQALIALPDGSVLAAGRVDEDCGYVRIGGGGALLAPAYALDDTCFEPLLAVDAEGDVYTFEYRSSGNVWRYELGEHPSFPGQPYWYDLPYPFQDGDPEDVAFDAEGRLLLLTQGSASASGLVLSDWSGDFGQMIGNWTGSGPGEIAFYPDGAPVVLRVQGSSGGSGTRYDLVLALKNQL